MVTATVPAPVAAFWFLTFALAVRITFSVSPPFLPTGEPPSMSTLAPVAGSVVMLNVSRPASPENPSTARFAIGADSGAPPTRWALRVLTSVALNVSATRVPRRVREFAPAPALTRPG